MQATVQATASQAEAVPERADAGASFGAPAAQQAALPALTGLRFFAAFDVVLYHFSRVALPAWAWPVGNLIRSGYVAVSLFFTLSGFIIAHTYLQGDGSLRGTARAFYVSRFARIYPAYLLAFLLAAPTDIAQSLHANHASVALAKLAVNGSLVLAMLQAWTPWTAWAWNFPAWSVSVEAFFYLVFPWVGTRIGASFGKHIAGSAGAADGPSSDPWLDSQDGGKPNGRRGPAKAPASWWLALAGLWLVSLVVPAGLVLAKGVTGPPQLGDHLQMAVEFTPLLRLPEFLFGILLGRAFDAGWLGFRRPGLLSGCAAAAILALLMFCPFIPHPLLAGGLMTPLFGALIVTLAAGKGPLVRLLSLPALILLGEASYGIYILQIPVSFLTRTAPPLTSARALLFYCVSIVVFAVLSFRFIESPLRVRLRRLLLRRKEAILLPR